MHLIQRLKRAWRKHMTKLSSAFARNTNTTPASTADQVPGGPPDHTPQPFNPALNLPIDIWRLVMDHLSLHQEFMLSRTCKDLRALVGRDWPSKVRQLSRVERLEFFKGLADVSLDHWACADCVNLHPVDLTNTRVMRARRPYACRKGPRPLLYLSSRQRQFRPPGSFRFATEMPVSEPHYMQHNHIQLALKYTRQVRLDAGHEQFLNRLLAPHRTKHFSESMYPDVSKHVFCIHREYSAWPKVNHGRFLLCERRKYSPYSDRFAKAPLKTVTWDVLALSLSRLAVCSHLRVENICGEGPPSARESREGISDWEHVFEGLLNQGPGCKFGLSCPCCPMDCEVRFEEDKRGYQSLVVCAWHDFGHEDSPLLKKLEGPQFKYFPPEVANAIVYKHDSVRELFEAR